MSTNRASIAWVAIAVSALSGVGCQADEPAPGKVSFLPLSSTPIIPKGPARTGDPEVDGGFSQGSTFSANLASDETYHYLFYRTALQPGSGIGMWRVEKSKVSGPADLMQRGLWEKLHHHAPLLTTQQVEPGVNGAPASLNAAMVGDELHVYFKLKRKKEAVVKVTGDGSAPRIQLPYPVQFPDDVIVTVTSGGTRQTLKPQHYRVKAMGTGRDATLVLKDPVPRRAKVDVRYRYNGWRYRVISRDQGRSFSEPELMLNQRGRHNAFGMASVVRVGDTYYMATNARDTSQKEGVAMRTSRDGVSWGAPVHVLDLGPEGSGYDHHIVGSNLSVEREGGTTYLVITATGGGGLMDEGHGVEDAFDYPETAHLFRAELDRALDAAAWEAYRYNPVMMRGAASGEAGGAIWQLDYVRHGQSYVGSFEGFGVVPGYSDGDDAIALVRDFQYGTPALRFGDEVFSQSFLSEWDGPSMMAAWSETYYDPGRFVIATAGGPTRYLSLVGDGTGGRAAALAAEPVPVRLDREHGFHRLGPADGSGARLVSPQRRAVSGVDVSAAPARDEMDEWLLYIDAGQALFQNRYSGNYLTATPNGLLATPFTGDVAQRWTVQRLDK